MQETMMLVMGAVVGALCVGCVWLFRRSAAMAAQAALGERVRTLEGGLAEAGGARDEAVERVRTLSMDLASKAETLSQSEHLRKELQGDREQLQTAFKSLAGQAVGETLAKTEERLIALAEQVSLSRTTSGELRDQTARLAKALSRPEIRGQYGEIQLRRVAELAGMTSYCDFDEQVSTRDDDGKLLRPDMIVRLPNDCVVAVDAKCNTYAYLEAVNAATDGEREHHLEKFASHVADQADRLGKKQYWAQWERAPKFVVMFIPGDHFIDAALQRKPQLIETAAQRNVILASPSTLIGLLRAVAVGWHEQRLAEQAIELRDLGRELHHRAATAFEHANALGKAIHQTIGHYNKLIGSVNTKLVPGLKRFEDVGVTSGKALPELNEEQMRPRAIESAQFVTDGPDA